MRAFAAIIVLVLGIGLVNSEAQDMTDRSSVFKEVGTLVSAGETGKAAKLLKKYLKTDPKSWEAYNLLGNISLVEGDLKDAAEYYGEALNIDPSQADIHNNLGNLELQRKNGSKALVYYQTAVRLNPKHSDAWGNMGSLYLATKQYAAAEKYLMEAVKTDENNVLALTLLAKIKAAQDRNDDAFSLFSRALKLEPQFTDVRIDFASFLASTGRHDEAEKQLAQALALAPKNARAHYINGIYMRDRKKLSESVKSLASALELDPANSAYNLDHALTLFQLEGTNALATVTKELKYAVKLARKDGRTAYLAGICFDDAGDQDNAITMYEKAIDLNYNVPKATLYVGENLLKLKKNRKAAGVLKELIGQLPADDQMRAKAEKLMKDNNLN